MMCQRCRTLATVFGNTVVTGPWMFQQHVSALLLVCVVVVLCNSVAYGQTDLPDTVYVPWGPDENLYEAWTCITPDNYDAVRIAYSCVGTPDTSPATKTWKLWYQVYDQNTGMFDTIRPLIQDGAGYSQTHPIDQVYIEPPTRQNSFIISGSPPITISNGQILLPFNFWPLDGNDLEHEDDAYTYMRSGVLVGSWNADRSDVNWSLGQTVGLPYSESRRGVMEPSVVELEQPGHLLMTMRGSNGSYHWYDNLNRPDGRLWKATSTDYGQSWSAVEEMTYSDGSRFYSPSSMSTIVRNVVDHKLYWVGNIVPSNPDGNYPRFPLVIGEVDEQSLSLVKTSVQVIATRAPATQTEKVQYSNFQINQSPITGDFTVTLPIYDDGAYIGYGTYVTDLGINSPPVVMPDQPPIDWTLRYEGDKLPTLWGAVKYSNGSVGNFHIAEGAPDMSTDGNVLNFAPRNDSSGLIGHATNFPSATGDTFLLDSTVGYTVEFRARLNSTDDEFPNAANIQVTNGTDSSSVYTFGLSDLNGDDAGYAVGLSSTSVHEAVSITDGFHTFRLTVLDAVAKLYVDGILVLTDFSGGGTSSTYKLRLGDFTSTTDADWDLDYLYVFDEGAIAPISHEPFAGDANGDGYVDETDASILAANWMATSDVNWWKGDFNDDGRVDDSDATILAVNWQASEEQSLSVPEPTEIMILVSAIGMGLLVHWKFASPIEWIFHHKPATKARR